MLNTHSAAHRAGRQRPAGGFTVVELLVSIAVIFVLVGTALVALKKARQAASRTTSLSALRQMSQAYTAYSNEFDGRLMPGFVDVALLTPPPLGATPVPLTAYYINKVKLNTEDTQSYVWRLAPYLDYGWRTYTADYRSPSLDSRFESELTGGCYGPGTNNAPGKIGLGLAPSFGLNSIFLGGDSFHGDLATIGHSPWAGVTAGNINPLRIAALRMSEVKNPAQIIVFGAATFSRSAYTELSGIQDKIKDVTLGCVNLCPPRTLMNNGVYVNTLWDVSPFGNGPNSGLATPKLNSGKIGMPFDRNGGETQTIPTCHLDGSVEQESMLRLGGNVANGSPPDMSRWDPKVSSTQ